MGVDFKWNHNVLFLKYLKMSKTNHIHCQVSGSVLGGAVTSHNNLAHTTKYDNAAAKSIDTCSSLTNSYFYYRKLKHRSRHVNQ